MDDRSEQLELSHDVTAPRTARHFVARALAGWGHPPAAIEQFQLLVSELVSNAVLHGDGDIAISVSERDDDDGTALVRVEVRNAGHESPTMRRAERHELSGRGLQLIDELAHRWGARTADGHTLVWFEGDPRLG